MLRLSLWIAWIFAIAYAAIPPFWLLVHPLAGFWRKQRLNPFLVLVPLWLLIMAGLAIGTLFGVELQLYHTAWSWLAWAVLFAAGVSIYRQVGHGFGRERLVGQAELQPQRHEQKLITAGLHGRVRHPIYLAHFLMLTAWAIGAGSVATLALWIFGVLTGAVMIVLEDRELERRFGDEYREYKRRVPALLPRLHN